MSDNDFRYRSAPSRRSSMEAYIAEQGYSTISELSRHFGVSEMTVRRDLARLAEAGRIRSVHGGASSVAPSAFRGADYERRAASQQDAKRTVAAAALAEITPGGVIAIDAGTSGAALAEVLPLDLNLTVVTPSLTVMTTLLHSPSIEVVGLGGVLHSETMSFAGPMVATTLADIQIETLFLTVSSLSERGAFCTTDFDAVNKRALIESATRVAVLADSSKFSLTAIAKICPWERIDILYIDDGINDDWLALLESSGVTVRIVRSSNLARRP